MKNELLKLLKISDNLTNYKIRFLIKDKDGYEPLDILEENFSEVSTWVGWKWKNDILNRPKVISFVRNYRINNDNWIFTGVYEVSKKNNFDNINDCQGYDLKLVESSKDLIGKICISYSKMGQQGTRDFENIVDDIEVVDKDYHLYNEIRVKSVDDWIKVLNEEKKVSSNKILQMLEYMYGKKDFISNLGEINMHIEDDIFGLDIYHFGDRITKLINIDNIKNSSNSGFRYWNIPFITVPKMNKGIFTYKLRPELVSAIEIVFPNWEKNINEPIKELEKEIKNIKNIKNFELNDNVRLEEVTLNLLTYQSINKEISDSNEKLPNYVKKVVNEVIRTHDGRVIEDYIYKLEYDQLHDKISQSQLEKMENFYKNRKDRYGYDILSYELCDDKYVEKYIEVKSTKIDNKTPIDITLNEKEFAEENMNHYYIYRVIIVDESNLQICKISGQELFDKYKFVPTKYKIYSKI